MVENAYTSMLMLEVAQLILLHNQRPSAQGSYCHNALGSCTSISNQGIPSGYCH
ncbi:rCG62166, partial [Rattus norvegicus]